MNAQGEDVVAGIRTPKPIEEMKAELPTITKNCPGLPVSWSAITRICKI